MKQNLLLIFSLFFVGQMVAQNIEISPDPVVISNVMSSDFEAIGHSLVTNTADTTRTFRWDKNIVEITDGWTVAVCDKNQCYSPAANSEMFELTAGEAGTMDVHVYPNGNDGYAIVEIIVTDEGDENLSVTNSYYYNAQPSATINLNRESVKVYPNPSNGVFTVKGNKQIASLDVYSLTGVKVESFAYNDGEWYDISDLPKGTYLVRLLDRNAQQLVTKLINKF